MYKSNLSYSQLQRYLAFLVSMGLLEKENVGGTEFFKLTKKGDDFLKEYQQIKRLLAVGSACMRDSTPSVPGLTYPPKRALSHNYSSPSLSRT